MIENLKLCKAFIFDLDGTVYIDDALIGEVKNTLQFLRDRGKQIVFLSNNSSRTHKAYDKKLKKLDIFRKGDICYSSLDAAEDFLLEERKGKTLYPVACKEVVKEIQSRGIKVSKDADIVLYTLDKEMTYEKINHSYQLLVKGAEFIVTHPDSLCPAKEGFIPDLGSIVKIMEEACNRSPDVVIGKPNSAMALNLAKRLKLSPNEMAMVGDRLNTDIAFGLNNGLVSVCVLTGDTTLEKIEKGNIKPHLVLKDVNELPKILE